MTRSKETEQRLSYLDFTEEDRERLLVLEPLLRIFGADLRGRLRGARQTRWGADRWSLGSYSVARPGGAPLRAVLAEPLADRLLFAGEACAADGWAATVAGAHRTGQSAARQALTMLP